MMAGRHGLSAPRLGCCALIAVKPRAACKSRLRAALPPPAHLKLVRSMLDHVQRAARTASTVRQVIVLTPERDTLPAEVPVLADTGAGLNSGLVAAHGALLGLGVHELLVLPADLPWVTPAEIDRLVGAGREGGFAIAPDLAGVGTNALFVRTERLFGFQFGSDSLRQHLIEAERLGLEAQQLRLPGLAFDVDRPEDLNRLDRAREASCLQEE
jgi:2-phospho-L-lactate guanylyltransferase